jgi:cobalt-zinc-cadmium resistance protein CzcA
MLDFYEQKLLPNCKIIEKTADRQFQNGEINYLEWAILMRQNFEAKNNYLNTIQAMNEAIVLLNYGL